MKRLLGLILVLTLVVSLVACSSEVAFDFEGDVLVVGLEADYRPFNWNETQANAYNHPLSGEDNLFVAGYDVEIAKIIARELGMTLEIKMIDWTALVPALKANKIDLIIAGMSPTAERMKSISFTNAYYNVNHVIVTRADNALNGMTSLTALEGRKGIGQMGTIYADLIDYAVTTYGATKISELDDIPMITNAVVSKTADFTIVERPVALGMLAQNANLVIAFESDENVFELDESDRTLSIGTRQIDTDLIKAINDILANISQESRDSLMAEAIERSE